MLKESPGQTIHRLKNNINYFANQNQKLMDENQILQAKITNATRAMETYQQDSRETHREVRKLKQQLEETTKEKDIYRKRLERIMEADL